MRWNDTVKRLAPRTRRSKPPWGGRDVSTRQVDPDTWLVEAGRPLRHRTFGATEARTSLLTHPRRLRRHWWRFERQMSRFLADEHIAFLLRELQVNCVIDVGANTGQFGQRVRHSGYRGRIVSFEPVAEFLPGLRKNAARDHDWRVQPFALGEENTTSQINATPGTKLSSLLPATDFGKGYNDGLAAPERQTIEVRRLDSVFDEVVDGIENPRVYLKLDTQGFDLPAFRGAGDRLGEIVAMQSEVACVPIYDGMPRLPEQLEEYESRGFEISGMFLISRHQPTLRVIEFDMTLVRPDGLAQLASELVQGES